MLNEVRVGQLTEATIERFKSLSRPPKYPSGVVPVEL